MGQRRAENNSQLSSGAVGHSPAHCRNGRDGIKQAGGNSVRTRVNLAYKLNHCAGNKPAKVPPRKIVAGDCLE
jgi:hypothetical protein